MSKIQFFFLLLHVSLLQEFSGSQLENYVILGHENTIGGKSFGVLVHMYRVLVQMYLYGPKQYLRNYWADLAEILRAMGALAGLTTNQISARYDQ